MHYFSYLVAVSIAVAAAAKALVLIGKHDESGNVEKMHDKEARVGEMTVRRELMPLGKSMDFSTMKMIMRLCKYNAGT